MSGAAVFSELLLGGWSRGRIVTQVREQLSSSLRTVSGTESVLRQTGVAWLI